MRGVLELLQTVPVPTDTNLFHVRRLPDSPSYYVGRDGKGHAAILISATGPGRTVPLQLAGIEARFGVPCNIAEFGLPERTETLSSIVCVSSEPGIETYFASIADSLMTILGAAPSTATVSESVQRLIELFERLQKPARRSVSGLIGELCLIAAASDTATAISAWRTDPGERFDFLLGTLRLDVKSSAERKRSHMISFEQANPPPSTLGVLASIWIEAAAGGTSLSDLIATIEGKLGSHQPTILRLRTVVADTLGQSLPLALGWRFDKALADASLALFDASAVPAIRPPLPIGVSAIHFVSNLDGLVALDGRDLAKSVGAAAALLPVSQSDPS